MQKLSQILLTSRVIVSFVPKFIAMVTGVGRGKMRLAAFNGPSLKTPLYAQKYCRYLLHKPSYNQFCPKIRCYGNGGQSGVNINVSVN